MWLRCELERCCMLFRKDMLTQHVVKVGRIRQKLRLDVERNCCYVTQVRFHCDSDGDRDDRRQQQTFSNQTPIVSPSIL